MLSYHRHRHRHEIPTDPADLQDAARQHPFDELWQREWHEKLLQLALARIGESHRNLFVFQQLALHGADIDEVCQAFEITRTHADTIRSRIKRKVTAEIAKIERDGCWRTAPLNTALLPLPFVDDA